MFLVNYRKYLYTRVLQLESTRAFPQSLCCIRYCLMILDAIGLLGHAAELLNPRDVIERFDTLRTEMMVSTILMVSRIPKPSTESLLLRAH